MIAPFWSFWKLDFDTVIKSRGLLDQLWAFWYCIPWPTQMKNYFVNPNNKMSVESGFLLQTGVRSLQPPKEMDLKNSNHWKKLMKNLITSITATSKKPRFWLSFAFSRNHIFWNDFLIFHRKWLELLFPVLYWSHF